MSALSELPPPDLSTALAWALVLAQEEGADPASRASVLAYLLGIPDDEMPAWLEEHSTPVSAFAARDWGDDSLMTESRGARIMGTVLEAFQAVLPEVYERLQRPASGGGFTNPG